MFEEGFLLLLDEPPEVEEDPPEVEDEPPPDDAEEIFTVADALPPNISSFQVTPSIVDTETYASPAAFALNVKVADMDAAPALFDSIRYALPLAYKPPELTNSSLLVS